MKFLSKVISLIFLLLFFTNSQAEDKISYVNMEELMNISEAGKSINSQLTALHKKNIFELKLIEDELKKAEAEIIKQKNVISKEEFDKKISVLRNKAKIYQKQRNDTNSSINKKRLDAMSKLINIIQPILAEYANQNSISIIFQKKNIIIGKTELDITNDILKILNEKHQKIDIN